MDPLRIYDYLITTRQHVLDAVRTLSPQQLQREFSFGLRTIASTLTHIMVSEWYYIQRLQGCDVPPYAQWPIKYEQPPALAVIEDTWRRQMNDVRAAVAAESAHGDWSRRIAWLSFPDDTRGNKRFHIACTAGDLITQLALHEVHHRAQIMVMMRELAAESPGDVAPLQDLDYNALMFQRIEAT